MGFINDGNSKYFNNVASEMKIPSFEFQHGDTSNLSMVSTYSENISGEFLYQIQCSFLVNIGKIGIIPNQIKL